MGHRLGAKLLGASMWFFIFYRARQDGKVLLVSGFTLVSNRVNAASGS